MRILTLISILILAWSAEAIAQDTFLISKGAFISVYKDRKDAQENYSDADIKPKLYLPAGTLLMKISDNQLARHTNTKHLVLTDTGVWGVSNLSPRDYYDEEWLKNLYWLLPELGREFQKDCPIAAEEDYVLWIFPDRTTDGMREFGTSEIATTLYPGDFLYNFSYEESGDWIIGYRPLTCARVRIPKRNVKLLETKDFGFGVRSKSEYRNIFIRRVRVSHGSAEERYRCGIKTKVTTTETQATEISKGLSVSLGLEYASIHARTEAKVDVKDVSSKLQSQEREFPGTFSIHRVYYLLGDGSKLEVLERWKKCSGENEENGQSSWPYFVYLAEGAQEVILNNNTANQLNIEMSPATGNWVLHEEEDYWAVVEFLQDNYHLSGHAVDFLMRTMMDWQD